MNELRAQIPSTKHCISDSESSVSALKETFISWDCWQPNPESHPLSDWITSAELNSQPHRMSTVDRQEMRSWKLAWGCMGRPRWSWGHWTPKFWCVFFTSRRSLSTCVTLLWWGSCNCLPCGSCLARHCWFSWGPQPPLFLWTCITKLKLLQVLKSEGQSETHEEVFALHACSVVSWPFVTPWLYPATVLCPWVSQARILEWLAISFSRGPSWARDWTCVSCIGRQILHNWATWEDCEEVCYTAKELLGFLIYTEVQETCVGMDIKGVG